MTPTYRFNQDLAHFQGMAFLLVEDKQNALVTSLTA